MASGSTHAPPDLAALIEDMRQQIANLTAQVNQPQPANPQQGALPPPVQLVAPIPRVKPERPQAFTGKKSENLESWIFQVQQFFDLSQVPNEDRIQLAASWFKDHAAIWWQEYHQNINWTLQPPTWEEFLQAIRAYFVPVNTSLNAYDRLQRLHQKTSVHHYNHEFRMLMLELPQMDAATRLHCYLRGLKDNIRPLVAMQQPANVAAAEAIAERVDASTYLPQQRNTNYRPNYGNRTPGGPSPMELDAITKLTSAERERLRKSGGCFRCRQTGHLARDCTLTNRTPPRINAITEEETLSESGKD